MNDTLAYRLSSGFTLNLHPVHEPEATGKITAISLVQGVSDSYCIGASLVVYDPKFALKEHQNNRWGSGEWNAEKTAAQGLSANFCFGYGSPSQNRIEQPLPIVVSIAAHERKKGRYSVPSADAHCPTLHFLAQMAREKMPHEFFDPFLAEAAIKSAKNRQWERPIKATELMMPCLWHKGEFLGYTDGDMARELKPMIGPLSKEAFRKTRKRAGFNSSPRLSRQRVPAGEMPAEFAMRLNEIREALGLTTVDDLTLHGLLETLFIWDFDLAFIVT